jgi:hypothetical protein
MPARDVALALAERFLRDGNFVLAGTQGRGVVGAMPAAAGAPDILDYDEYGFAGLAVQSVGVEEGVPEPKVHIYVTKGRTTESEVEVGDEEVTVVVNRIGRVVIKPETASTVTHAGNVYLRGGRVACGSSCAPSTESYAGTFGALARKAGAGGNRLYLLSNNHVRPRATIFPLVCQSCRRRIWTRAPECVHRERSPDTPRSAS